jgi:NTE family protein
VKRPPFETIALVLQGGGALGAYQAGVYEGLHEAGIEPDWAAGISIGAINAALIAGNPRERRVERLHAFWDTVTAPALLPATPTWWSDWVERTTPAARCSRASAVSSCRVGRRRCSRPRRRWQRSATTTPRRCAPRSSA